MTCGLCGQAAADGYLRTAGHSLVRCRSCGLIRTDDFRLDASVYAPEKYFTVKDGYVDRWDEFCAGFEAVVAKIRRRRDGGALLDVGTGVGALIHVARGNGFEVTGVETSEWAADYARRERQLDVRTGTLRDAAFPDASFDIVVVNHVLEHVDDLGSLLAEIRRVLAHDGLLVIGVPNAASFMAKILGARWSSWRPDQHIWHFTPATLERLLASGGFRTVGWEARDNSVVRGWGPKAVVQRAIGAVASRLDRAEAMLLFARKRAEDAS